VVTVAVMLGCSAALGAGVACAYVLLCRRLARLEDVMLPWLVNIGEAVMGPPK
jgi:hypothetical protein